MSKEIGIINYGCGNLKSVENAVLILGYQPTILTSPKSLNQFHKIILPGVGAFPQAMANLTATGFKDGLNNIYEQGDVKILGICLGMQLMCVSSEEGKPTDGLGWLDARVVSLSNRIDSHFKVPHLGWNNLSLKKEHLVFEGVPDQSDVYFVHSYCVECADERDVIATSEYGIRFVSIFSHENIIGMQFHPEKSHTIGLKLLKNFLDS